MSIPVVSLSRRKDKAEQISHWWQAIEQQSLKLSLDYEYMIETDITDCYGSIYTHAIVWALHGKKTGKKEKNNKSLIGNIIDWHIQNMSYGQTNGIPQGSVLMDFIAEMVLGYADSELSNQISKIDDYHILRYRDDYRIFVNNPQDGEKILKKLTEIMIDLGLKLNPNKTKFHDQIITASIKQDKLAWMLHNSTTDKNIQKELLIIYNHAVIYQNAGSVAKALNSFDVKLSRQKKINDVDVLAAIMTDIAYHNPRNYPVFASIVSKLLKFKPDDAARREIIRKIKNRFNTIPNTGYMDIWLQRITLPFDREIKFSEKICQLVYGKKIRLWNNDWLNSKTLEAIINPEKIIDKQKLSELSPVIHPSEISLFLNYGY
jgi:hypothetical protein